MGAYWQGALIGAALCLIVQGLIAFTVLAIAASKTPDLHDEGVERAERYANGEIF